MATTGVVKNQVEYLLERRVAGAREVVRQLRKSNILSLSDRKKLDAVRAYSEELRRLTDTEIEERYKQEKEKESTELRIKAETEERQRFFNQPHAQADFEYWAKAAHWTLDEAVALSLGRAPEHVTWERIRPFCQVSPLAFQYQRRRELALRAVPWKDLFDPVLPTIFLAWAKRLDLTVPQQLGDAVEARGGHIGDWKSLYDDLNAKFHEHHEQWVALCEERGQLVQALSARIDELQAIVASTAPSPPAASDLGTRERESLLRLVIGMAVRGYGYDPRTKRSDKVAEIAGDLDALGVRLDPDTVRKWLKAAAELMPPQNEAR